MNANDTAPYVGFGAMSVEQSSGTKAYVAKWYKKLMFKEPNDENSTKQENVSFAHTTIEADVIPQENYDVSITKSFESEAEAVTFLKTQAGISTT